MTTWTRRPTGPGFHWFLGDAALYKVGFIEFDKPTIVKAVKTKAGYLYRWGIAHGGETQINGLFCPVGDPPPMPTAKDWTEDEEPTTLEGDTHP